MKLKNPFQNMSTRQILLRLWPLYAAAFVVAATCAVIFSPAPVEEAPKYALETAGEIDFTAPELPVHSAGDGIAVVTPPPAPDNRPAIAVADPAEIW